MKRWGIRGEFRLVRGHLMGRTIAGRQYNAIGALIYIGNCWWRSPLSLWVTEKGIEVPRKGTADDEHKAVPPIGLVRHGSSKFALPRRAVRSSICWDADAPVL